jgi:hypothetical protein
VSLPCPLSAFHHPRAVALDLAGMADHIAAVEAELTAHAATDQNSCFGYFPALRGIRGIDSDLPACVEFAARLPALRRGGAEYRFNFIRLSLTQQSADPAFHLDSDAATALTGDATTLRGRRVARLLLNLSTQSGRAVHFLDIDPYSVDLISEGSYVRAVDPRALVERARTAVIPARSGSRVAGLVFAANSVLHSGVDDARGHFVAAYGIDADVDAPSDRPL